MGLLCVARPMDTLRGEYLVMSQSETRDHELIVHNHPLSPPQICCCCFLCIYPSYSIELNFGILIVDRSGYCCTFGSVYHLPSLLVFALMSIMFAVFVFYNKKRHINFLFFCRTWQVAKTPLKPPRPIWSMSPGHCLKLVRWRVGIPLKKQLKPKMCFHPTQGPNTANPQLAVAVSSERNRSQRSELESLAWKDWPHSYCHATGDLEANFLSYT